MDLMEVIARLTRIQMIIMNMIAEIIVIVMAHLQIVALYCHSQYRLQ